MTQAYILYIHTLNPLESNLRGGPAGHKNERYIETEKAHEQDWYGSLETKLNPTST